MTPEPADPDIQARIDAAEERVRRGPDGTETYATVEDLAGWIEELRAALAEGPHRDP